MYERFLEFYKDFKNEMTEEQKIYLDYIQAIRER